MKSCKYQEQTVLKANTPLQTLWKTFEIQQIEF